MRKAEKERFVERVALWLNDPASPVLRVHALKGKYQGYYSMNVGGDLRALYVLVGNQMVLFDLIGTHSQLYGK